ncbi:MAG: hypothetical protein V4515_09845 [Chloroflexota bacterium]
MRRHDFDALSFISGLLFAAAGLVLLGGGAVRDGLALPWAGPIVAIGVAALIVIAARPRAVSTANDEPPADPPTT